VTHTSLNVINGCGNALEVGVSKKTEKPIKSRKRKINNRKNQTMKKTIKPIRILKKSTGSVQFRFYKPETEKTEPNPNKKKPEKPSQTGKKRAKPKKPSQTGKKPS
jgi:hypothetical protein